MLNIASTNILERHRGRRWFRAFRQIAESLNPWDATYYECVNNVRLAAYFMYEGLSSDCQRRFYAMHRIYDPAKAL